MVVATESQETLRLRFCPPIDEALFYAICSDYDLATQDGLAQCGDQLNLLKEAALRADTTSFDEAGAGFFAQPDLLHDSDAVESLTSTSEGRRRLSQSSDPFGDFDPSITADDPFADSQCLHGSSEEAKAEALKEIFPHIVPTEVVSRLRKSGGNFTRAIDELLNFDYIPRSIDGFGLLESDMKPHKPRRKRRRNDSSRSACSGRDVLVQDRNAWLGGKESTQVVSLGITRRHPAINLYPTASADNKSHAFSPESAIHQINSRRSSTPAVSGDTRKKTPLVLTQSLSNTLDLHGFTVSEAVSLTREHVRLWWQGLGDRKYATGGGGGPLHEGYRIVTGAGHHSKNGVPRIRPAVVRALVSDGWRIRDDQPGEILVTGKARRS